MERFMNSFDEGRKNKKKKRKKAIDNTIVDAV
jgi:hypothetical protein